MSSWNKQRPDFIHGAIQSAQYTRTPSLLCSYRTYLHKVSFTFCRETKTKDEFGNTRISWGFVYRTVLFLWPLFPKKEIEMSPGLGINGFLDKIIPIPYLYIILHGSIFIYLLFALINVHELTPFLFIIVMSGNYSHAWLWCLHISYGNW